MDRLQKNFQRLEIDTKKKKNNRSSTLIESPIHEEEETERNPTIYHLRSSSLHDIIPPSPQQQNINEYQYRKKWYQLPRMNLKRNQSMVPIHSNGGLKAGTVEPPEPPPQLELDLDDWLSTTEDLIINNKHQSVSTPVSPSVSLRHKKSSSSSILSLPPAKQQKQRPISFNEFESMTTSSLDEDLLISPSVSTNSATNNNTPSYTNTHSIYTPDTNELVINFKHIKPRTTKIPVKRRKIEYKALHEWQQQLLLSLNNNLFPKRTTFTIASINTIIIILLLLLLVCLPLSLYMYVLAARVKKIKIFIDKKLHHS